MSTDEHVPSEIEMIEGERQLPNGVYKPLEEDEYARGLARVRRDAKAEALREAVRDMGEWADEGVVVVGEDDEDSWVELTVGEWLCARADQVKQGATNG